MDKFSVLPTDERFLSLYEEQKLGLFYGICSLPDNGRIKKNVIIDEEIEEIKERPLEEFASKALLQRMRMTYESQGFESMKVKEELKKFLLRLKDAEIKSLEKKKHE